MAEATVNQDSEICNPVRQDRKVFSAYVITNKVNGKQYVGITSRSVKKRWRVHVRDAHKGAPMALSRAIVKYGEANFTMAVVALSFSRADLFALERILIEQYGTYRNGYNLTFGGEGGFGAVRSAEFRAAVSRAQKGKKKSPEQIAKMVESKRGFKHTEKTKAFIATVWKGRKHTPETIAKMKNKSPEWRANRAMHAKKMWEARKAEAEISGAPLCPQALGRKHTPEAIANMRDSHDRLWAERRSKAGKPVDPSTERRRIRNKKTRRLKRDAQCTTKK